MDLTILCCAPADDAAAEAAVAAPPPPTVDADLRARLHSPNHYRALGVPVDCGAAELKKAVCERSSKP